MRRGSLLDPSDRRSAWIRWLIIGLVFLALLVVAARVAGAHSFASDVGLTVVACADAKGTPCADHDGSAKGKGCQGVLGCHIMDVQPEFAVATPTLRRSFLRRNPALLASRDIAPLFHPPKPFAPA